MSKKELPITASGLTRSEFMKRYGFDPLKPLNTGADHYNLKFKKVQQWKKNNKKGNLKKIKIA